MTASVEVAAPRIDSFHPDFPMSILWTGPGIPILVRSCSGPSVHRLHLLYFPNYRRSNWPIIHLMGYLRAPSTVVESPLTDFPSTPPLDFTSAVLRCSFPGCFERFDDLDEYLEHSHNDVFTVAARPPLTFIGGAFCPPYHTTAFKDPEYHLDHTQGYHDLLPDLKLPNNPLRNIPQTYPLRSSVYDPYLPLHAPYPCLTIHDTAADTTDHNELPYLYKSMITKGGFGIVTRVHKRFEPKVLYTQKQMAKTETKFDKICEEVSLICKTQHPHVVELVDEYEDDEWY